MAGLMHALFSHQPQVWAFGKNSAGEKWSDIL